MRDWLTGVEALGACERERHDNEFEGLQAGMRVEGILTFSRSNLQAMTFARRQIASTASLTSDLIPFLDSTLKEASLETVSSRTKMLKRCSRSC